MPLTLAGPTSGNARWKPSARNGAWLSWKHSGEMVANRYTARLRLREANRCCGTVYRIHGGAVEVPGLGTPGQHRAESEGRRGGQVRVLQPDSARAPFGRRRTAACRRVDAARVHALGQNNLGVMYESGRGVERDDAEAVRWYRCAAEQEDALGQTDLGVMYENGRGVERDDAEAVRWFRRAAEQGAATGQTNLGDMYTNGRGVQRDDAEAVDAEGQSAAL